MQTHHSAPAAVLAIPLCSAGFSGTCDGVVKAPLFQQVGLVELQLACASAADTSAVRASLFQLQLAEAVLTVRIGVLQFPNHQTHVVIMLPGTDDSRLSAP